MVDLPTFIKEVDLISVQGATAFIVQRYVLVLTPLRTSHFSDNNLAASLLCEYGDVRSLYLIWPSSPHPPPTVSGRNIYITGVSVSTAVDIYHYGAFWRGEPKAVLVLGAFCMPTFFSLLCLHDTHLGCHTATFICTLFYMPSLSNDIDLVHGMKYTLSRRE